MYRRYELLNCYPNFDTHHKNRRISRNLYYILNFFPNTSLLISSRYALYFGDGYWGLPGLSQNILAFLNSRRRMNVIFEIDFRAFNLDVLSEAFEPYLTLVPTQLSSGYWPYLHVPTNSGFLTFLILWHPNWSKMFWCTSIHTDII